MNHTKNTDKPFVLLKYGGNAMSNHKLKKEILQNIILLKKEGFHVVIVHGGGPFIKKALDEAKIKSEFIDGQRKTSLKAFEHVEMTLKGKVNTNLVSILHSMGEKAVGMSGQDGRSVIAKKRIHNSIVDGKSELVDLGQVGDVKEVNPQLIQLLVKNDFIPVLACTAANEKGEGFNINGDMFAGHVAGALKVDHYIVLTDVDGLMHDKDKPSTLISEIKLNDLKELIKNGTIQGGMIPKIESCEIAITKGAKTAKIINGTKPDQIAKLSEGKQIGTNIIK